MMNGQAFFITATNTDTGKTFTTAALLKTFLETGHGTVAIKPVQSGAIMDETTGTMLSPDVLEFAKVSSQNNYPSRYALPFPSSPHYAAGKEGIQINVDDIHEYCKKYMAEHEITLIEGAGGIFVPLNQDETFLDVMKMLSIPIILVCKNELGMINQTLLSIECLTSHGLEVACLVVNFTNSEDEIHCSNLEYLKTRFPGCIISLPDFGPDACINQEVWKKFLIFTNNYKQKKETFSHENPQEIDLDFDRDHIWHPYTSATSPLKTYGVTHARGHYIYLKDQVLLDGMSSWWCAVHGYNVRELNQAAKNQIDSFSHVMFGGLTHAPAINLAKKILDIVPSNLSRIFYCDSGSVSVEVAMKMALQYQQNINPQKTKILTVLGGYHGDTFGAMSVCDPENGMHFLFQNVLARQIFAPRPECPWGADFDQASLAPIRQIIAEHGDEIAAIIIEPLVQGAGGMWFYHENYLHFLRKASREMGALLIFDEIATGFGRVGELFASEKARVSPDIMCIGKAMTGGYMSFGATLASREVAETISRNDRVFMHGPTFMANPLACSIALKSIDILLKSPWKQNVERIEKLLEQGLRPCEQFQEVSDVRVLGAIGVVELASAVNLERIQEFFVQQGVWIRPFGRNIYVMPPFGLSDQEIHLLCSAIFQAISLRRY